MHGLESEPIFRGRVAEATHVLVEPPVELDGAVDASLEEGAAVRAPRVEGHVAGPYEVRVCWAGDARAILGQLLHQVFVLTLHRLQLLHLPHQFR